MAVPVPWFWRSYIAARIFAELGFTGIWLFGYGWPVTGFRIAVATLDKSPLRNASSGTMCECVTSLGSRTPSNVAKKNVRFLTTGPPPEAPKLLVRTFGLIALPAASLGAKRLTQLSALSLMNQNPVPCNWFVPLLLVVVMSVTCMNSALLFALLTLNSSIDSTDGNISRAGAAAAAAVARDAVD